MIVFRLPRFPPAFRVEFPAGDVEMERLVTELGRILASRGYLVSPKRRADRNSGLNAVTFQLLVAASVPPNPSRRP